MPAHTAQHTLNRLQSQFATLVDRAEEDILAELAHPRKTSLNVNDDRKARWTAVQRLIAMGQLVVVLPETYRVTRRPPPGGGPRRERLEVRVRLPGPNDEERI